jgi:SAM-dependent methyltransferase
VTVTCAVCGAESPRAKLRKQGVEILECRDCGLAFWTPPGDFRPAGVYDAAYFTGPSASRGYDDYAGLEPALRLNFARRYAKLHLPRPGARLLDIGAAFGFAIVEAQSAGWDATGLEISRAAAERARHTAGDRIVIADALQAPFARDGFDAVTLWDVLEHLSDPHAAIAEVARLLRPGGHLVLSTGDVGSLAARVSGARWHLYNLPEHLFFYSRESLRRLLFAHGFQVVRLEAETSYYTLGYLIERLRKALLGRGRAVGASWPGADLTLPVNLFDIVSAEAVFTGEPR